MSLEVLDKLQYGFYKDPVYSSLNNILKEKIKNLPESFWKSIIDLDEDDDNYGVIDLEAEKASIENPFWDYFYLYMGANDVINIANEIIEEYLKKDELLVDEILVLEKLIFTSINAIRNKSRWDNQITSDETKQKLIKFTLKYSDLIKKIFRFRGGNQVDTFVKKGFMGIYELEDMHPEEIFNIGFAFGAVLNLDLENIEG